MQPDTAIAMAGSCIEECDGGAGTLTRLSLPPLLLAVALSLVPGIGCKEPNPRFSGRPAPGPQRDSGAVHPDATVVEPTAQDADPPGPEAGGDRNDVPPVEPQPDATVDAPADAASDRGLNPPASSLIGHWNLNEMQGVLAIDSSGNANHGHLVSFPASGNWVATPRGGGLRFPLATPNVGVEVIAVPAIVAIRRFTLAAWTMRDTLDGNRRMSVVSREISGGAGKETYSLTFDGPNLVLYMYPERPNNTLAITAPVPTPTGRWVHVAATYDGSAMKLYRDGDLVAMMNYTGELVPSAASLYIGTNKNDNVFLVPQPFAGILDEVVVYSEAQPIEVIRALRDGTAP
jgi:hypothetical protein